jgi:hypothetical protein
MIGTGDAIISRIISRVALTKPPGVSSCMTIAVATVFFPSSIAFAITRAAATLIAPSTVTTITRSEGAE